MFLRRLCLDNYTCYRTETQVEDQIYCLTPSQCTYTYPAGPCTSVITIGGGGGGSKSSYSSCSGGGGGEVAAATVIVRAVVVIVVVVVVAVVLCLTLSQCTYTEPAVPCTNVMTPGAWHVSSASLVPMCKSPV